MSDLRGFLARMKKSGELEEIKRRVSPRYEIARITASMDGSRAVLFENVRGSKMRVVANLVGTQSRFGAAAGAKNKGIHEAIAAAGKSTKKPGRGKAIFLENSASDASALPVVTHFEKESGPFITASIIHAKNPETKRQNASFHRMMPMDEKRFSVRMVEGRHLHRCFADAQDHGEDLKVAVTVGVHPAVSIAGAYQAQWGSDEMQIANALMGGRLAMAESPRTGILVPARAEIVMEGRVLQDVTHEEWMVEMLKTYDRKRRQPVFELDRLHHRNDAIFSDILSGYAEHRLLMGMPVEARLQGELRVKFGPKTRVALTDGGCNWLHAVVSMKKKADAGPRLAIKKAFDIHRSLKQVTIVDTDIDPRSAVQVEYALATRFQADRDLTIIRGVRGSSLDPSSDQKNLKTAKTGIDATMPLKGRKGGFEAAKIPRSA